jgi:hypothetical protein
MDARTGDPASYDWPALQQAYADGRFASEGHELSPHLVFEDGTIWFTHGVEPDGGHQVGLPLLGGLFVILLGGTIVCLADGLVLGWWFGLGLALIVAALVLLLRRIDRAERAARDRLRLGVFFRPDGVVIRHGDHERAIRRADVSEVFVCFARKGEESSSDWLHLRIGAEVVPTRIRLVGAIGRAQLERVRAWHRS